MSRLLIKVVIRSIEEDIVVILMLKNGVTLDNLSVVP